MTVRTDENAAADDLPTLVALHFLGGSAAQWQPLFDRLAGRLRCVAVDLPGFGGAAQVPGYDVAAMAAHVAAEVRRLAPRRWLLAGHSMGAKVACAVARLAEDGGDGLAGLTRLVLLAGSPPQPEPMEEGKRDAMRGWFAGSEAESRREADGYIRDNVAGALREEWHAGAVDAVVSAARAAWVAWLDGGSREDWTDRIGVLRTPALILAGGKDAALGLSAQKTAMRPHFASARLHALPDAGHLLPLEQPDAVAACIRTFAGVPVPGEPAIPEGYRALIDSRRVSARTRDVLLARAAPVPDAPNILSADEMTALRALTGRIIPQAGERRIDIAARLLDQMTRGTNDGWRFAALRPDIPALRAGLRDLDAVAQTLDAAGFAYLSGPQQDGLLSALTAGTLTSPFLPEDGGLTAEQLKLWFEDMRSFATQIYVAHPATQARIGYSGIGNRGDGAGPQGFQAVGLGRRDAWEPEAQTGADP